MTLVMFDIDGTLTETFDVDSDCYVRALDAVFGFKDVNADWSSYKHPTDSGILAELFQTRLNRALTDWESVAFQNRFLSLLSEAAKKSPEAFRAVAGAGQMLHKLMDSPTHAVCLATGGWKISAMFKLTKAGLEIAHLPAAFGDDAEARDDIMTVSWRRAAISNQRDVFDTIVYVGDGTWDLKAAKKLGFEFIGIGSGERAEQFHSAGAEFVFPDYTNEGDFLDALEKCSRRPVRSVPALSASRNS